MFFSGVGFAFSLDIACFGKCDLGKEGTYDFINQNCKEGDVTNDRTVGSKFNCLHCHTESNACLREQSNTEVFNDIRVTFGHFCANACAEIFTETTGAHVNKTDDNNEDIIKNIIQNLLETILKSVEMGDIIVSLSNPDEETVKSKNIFGANFVKISISSSSLLLSENDLEYMLDPYKIVDSSNRKNLLRSMILANVKNLTQNLNGVFWVESQILKNTTFNIIIPQGKN